MTSKIVTTDVLVIGGGLAGERCAIEAAAAGQEALILSLVPPRRSHSCAAQGGMQAALANCVKAEGDSPTVHFLDTVRGSDWGADQEVARIFAEEAPIAVRELAYFGVPWTRVHRSARASGRRGPLLGIDPVQDSAPVNALISADKAGIELSFQRAAAIDLAGREVFEAVQMSVNPKVITTPTAVSPEDPRSYYSVADRIARETPNCLHTNQYHNQSNPLAHYRSTGPEIWEQLGDSIDAVVVATGTGTLVNSSGELTVD